MSQPSIAPSSDLLARIDASHSTLLEQLDELNGQIEQVLSQQTTTKGKS